MARDVVQTLLAERQRRLDAPKLIATRATGRGETVQSAEALSYALGDEQIVGLESSDPNGRRLTLRLSGGGTLDVKTRARGGSRSRLEAMSGELPKPRRRPAEVKVRPGNRRAKPRLDPALGLEEIIGEVAWQPASAGAYVAVIERNSEGNAVGCGRLSGEDRNETMVTQVEGLLDLEQRTPELTYRYLILAVDMSGKRLVRADPLIPPAAGTAERDDMVILDQFIQQGWVEHLAFWSVDRIARKVLPAHVLYNRWEENDLGLWLVVNGGQIDYQDDDLLLGVLTMTSSNERKNIVRRTRGGLMRKGPLAGRGHLNTCPTFFRRDEFGDVEEDLAIWKYCLRMFELADQGREKVPSVGASTREIAAQLAEEGYEIDHDRIRVLLEDIVYATGEWKVKVSGIEIPQTPIQLKNPVPLDRFQRVQDWLELRKGGSENTQLGEYAFNYVETVHQQCQGEKGGVRNRKIRVRGYNLLHIKRQTRMLRHTPVVPDCCKGKGRGKGGAWTWPVDELEQAAFLKVREIASHPEVLRQLTLATRHVVADTSARLTGEERRELEEQLEALIQHRDAAADAWVEKTTGEETPDFANFHLVTRAYDRRINALERRLENDEALALAQESQKRGEGSQDKRLEDFLEIMTVERPSDPRMMALRARLFSIIVSKLIIDDDGRGPITLILESNLVPPQSPVELANPLHAAGDFLDRYRREKEGRTNSEDRMLQRAQAVKTDFESSHSKSVFTLLPELKDLPTGVALRRMRRNSLGFPNWHIRGPVKQAGAVGWRASVSITSDETLAASTVSEPELALIGAIRPETIFSTPQILDATDVSRIERQRRKVALLALERRGWLRRVVADGVSVWSVVDDYAHFFAKPERVATAELVDTNEPRKRGYPRLSATATPKTVRSRARHAARQERDHAAALEHSLSVAEARALSGLTCSELLAGVRANELIVCVFPHGEARFPRWQWDEEGRVRPEIPAIIATANEHGIWPYTAHRLLTRSRGRGYKPPLANRLAEEQDSGSSPTVSAVQMIIDAIVHPAGLASSAPQRRKRKTPDSF